MTLYDFSHILVIPCHSIYKGRGTGRSPDDWYLAPFQYEGNDHLAWLEQLRRGISLLKSDPKACLIISGGKTKKVGSISESFSYLNVVLQNRRDFLEDQEDLLDRIFLEEYARDLYENVAYSLKRFEQICGTQPQELTIIGYEFKRKRFMEYHVPACFDKRAQYIGIDPRPDYSEGLAQWEAFYDQLAKNEYEHALRYFEKDPTGESIDVLVRKKEGRNPYNTVAPY